MIVAEGGAEQFAEPGFHVGGQAAERTNPTRDVVERRAVYLFEGERDSPMLLEHDVERR